MVMVRSVLHNGSAKLGGRMCQIRENFGNFVPYLSVAIFVSLNSLHGVLSMIFGFYGKFWIDISKNKNEKYRRQNDTTIRPEAPLAQMVQIIMIAGAYGVVAIVGVCALRFSHLYTHRTVF